MGRVGSRRPASGVEGAASKRLGAEGSGSFPPLRPSSAASRFLTAAISWRTAASAASRINLAGSTRPLPVVIRAIFAATISSIRAAGISVIA